MRFVHQPDISVSLRGSWRQGHGPLWERLATAIEDAVLRDELPAGSRLPSERALGATLGIGRSTVVRAMGALAQRGIVERAHGAGTFVAQAGSGQATRRSGPWPLSEHFRPSSPAPSGLQAAVVASHEDLPPGALEVTLREALGGAESGSGYVIPGLPSTREALADMLTRTGLRTGPDSMIVTTGATQSLTLIIGQFLRDGDVVVVDKRAYPTAVQLLRQAGARILSAPETHDGVTDALAVRRLALQHRAAMVVIMSTCNTATGASLPETAHPPLLDLARRGVVVVDDRTLADYHPAPAPRPLAAVAAHPNLVCIGSLSKIYWGGLRVGWLRVHESMVPSLVRAKGALDAGTSVPSQVIANRLLAEHEDIMARRRADVDASRDVARAAVERADAGWRIEGKPVGPVLWVRLPVRDSATFAELCHRRGLNIGYGGHFRADGRPSQHIRLALTGGVEATGSLFDELLRCWNEFLGTDGDDHDAASSAFV